MSYLQLDFDFDNEKLDPEILMAHLSEIGFESFETPGKGLIAYIRKGDFSEIALRNLLDLELQNHLLTYVSREHEDQNWNAVWESNFQPVVIAGRCLVRAPFHPPQPEIPMEIVIEPKMSFGTAHHETTALMMELMFAEALAGKAILDMGCGTGILAILASLLGAGRVDAIDNDEWAFANARENTGLNGCGNITVIKGDAGSLGGQSYDIILANINRNILLDDMSVYASVLADGGVLLLSGFYGHDLEILIREAEKLKLNIDRYLSRNSWVAARFLKSVNLS